MLPSWSRLARLIVLSLCFACSASWGAPRKKWKMLTGCQYVARSANDGDSFRVRCADKELIEARAYGIWLLAPETRDGSAEASTRGQACCLGGRGQAAACRGLGQVDNREWSVRSEGVGSQGGGC